MAKKNHDTAVIAAIAVASIVTFSVSKVFMDSLNKIPYEPITEFTTAVVTKNTPPPTILYNVPLETELQLHIIQVAESYGIDPAIIFAMCFWESTYNPANIGDSGESFGLMQIQPKWHSDRMARLNCTDLLDPFQNVIIGTDYLAEQLARYGGDINKALVAYNAGHYSGTITKYATVVMAMAEELRGTTYELHK